MTINDYEKALIKKINVSDIHPLPRYFLLEYSLLQCIIASWDVSYETISYKGQDGKLWKIE